MNKFTVDFVIEPSGREVSMQIESETGKQAMEEALYSLKLEAGELLHTIHAYISRPIA